jgi:hypothetical protein
MYVRWFEHVPERGWDGIQGDDAARVSAKDEEGGHLDADEVDEEWKTRLTRWGSDKMVHDSVWQAKPEAWTLNFERRMPRTPSSMHMGQTWFSVCFGLIPAV